MKKLDGKEMLKRYLYAIEKKLPLKNREDLAREMESLIMDELEARFGAKDDYDRDEVVTLINEMGHPRLVAARYRSDGNMLISPELGEIYRMVLFIVCGAISLGLFISFIVGLFTGDGGGILGRVFGFLGSLFSGILSGVGVVTIIFMLIQRFGDVDPKELDFNADWTPDELEPVEDDERVRLWEPIVTLFFISLAAVLVIIFAYGDITRLFPRWASSCGVLPVISMPAFRTYAPLWLISLGLGAAVQVLSLVRRRRDLQVRLGEVLNNVFDIVVLVVLIQGPTLIYGPAIANLIPNPQGFPLKLIENPDLYLDRLWAVFIVLTVLGLVDNLVKTVRGAARKGGVCLLC